MNKDLESYSFCRSDQALVVTGRIAEDHYMNMNIYICVCFFLCQKHKLTATTWTHGMKVLPKD